MNDYLMTRFFSFFEFKEISFVETSNFNDLANLHPSVVCSCQTSLVKYLNMMWNLYIVQINGVRIRVPVPVSGFHVSQLTKKRYSTIQSIHCFNFRRPAFASDTCYAMLIMFLLLSYCRRLSWWTSSVSLWWRCLSWNFIRDFFSSQLLKLSLV